MMIKAKRYMVFDEGWKLISCVGSDKTYNDFAAKYQPENEYHIVDISEGANPLEAMLTLQFAFQARLGQLPVEEQDRTQYVMNNMLYTEAEGHEFLREIEGFKSWKHYDWSAEEKEAHYKAALEEFVDMLHFVLNIALAMGFSADAIYENYVSKNIVNHRRQDNGY